MFDRTLNGLIWTLMRGAIRKTWRMIKTPSGALMAAFMLFMIGFGVVPQLMMAFFSEGEAKTGLVTIIADALPPILYVATVMLIITDAGKSMLELRPPELQFVLAGPFSNSHILSYRLMTVMIGWTIMSLFFACLMAVHFATWIGGFLFVAIGGGFVMMLTFLYTLLSPRIRPTFLWLFRIGILLGIVILVGEASWRLSASGQGDWSEQVNSALSGSVSGKILGFPFQPFSFLASQELGLPMLANALLSGLLFVTVVGCCYASNANFSELAVEGVARRQEKLNRIKGGNVYAVKVRKAQRKQLLPVFPWWRGAGPVAWSQLTYAIRRTGRLLPGILLIGILAAIVAFCATIQFPRQLTDNQMRFAMPAAMGVATYIGFLVSLTSQTGFTANLKLLTWYQLLPVRPIPLAVGMLAGMVALLMSIRMACFFVAAVLSNQPADEIVSILIASMVFDLSFASMINFVAATTDLRPMPQGTPDVFQGAKGMVFMLAMSVAILPILIITAISVVVVGLLLGFSWTPCSWAATAGLLAPLPAIWWVSGHRFLKRELATE